MPYGLFDYIPESTIHTMGLTPKGPITTKMLGEECPVAMPPACPDGSIPRVISTRRDSLGCQIPTFAPCPKPPSKCPTTLTQGGCNYRLV